MLIGCDAGNIGLGRLLSCKATFSGERTMNRSPGRNQYDAPPIVDRFREKYTVDPASGCWLWHGCMIPAGYGAFRIGGKMSGAHRWAYEQLVGSIPEGMVIDHLCRRRNCVNPAHMEPVTNEENIQRGEGIGAKNARKTHCNRGHRLAGANLRIEPSSGKRLCRKCRRIMLGRE